MISAPQPPGDRHAESRLAVHAALLEGDAGLAFHLIMALMSSGVTMDEVLFEVLAPVQSEVGARWAQADYRISDEHAVSNAMETVISLLAGAFDADEDGTPLVVACAEGDQHALSARVLAAHLVGAGCRVTNLGGSVPADDLRQFLEDAAPEALVLTCAMSANLAGARSSIAAAHAAGVPVVAGGRGFGTDERWAHAVGADAWLSDPRQLASLLASWEPDIVSAEQRAAAAVHPERADLEEAWWSIAEDAAARIGEAPVPARREELRTLCRVLDAALLVGDPAVVAGHVEWHEVFRAAHRETVDTSQLVRALADSLPPQAVTARSFLEQAIRA